MGLGFRFIPILGSARHQTALVASTWSGGGSSPTLLTSCDLQVGSYNVEGEWQGTQLNTPSYGILDMHACPTSPELIAVACSDGCFRLFTTGGWREEKRVVASTAGAAIISVRWSHDGSALCTGGEDGCVKVWSKAGALRTTLATCASPVYGVRWGADTNSLLWASGRDLFMAGLGTEAPASVGGGGGMGGGGGGSGGPGGPSGATSWRAHEGVILALDWCPTTGRIVSGGEDGRYKLWDTMGRPLAVGPVEEHVILSCAWAPRGGYFAVGSHGLLLLCDASGNVRVREGLKGGKGYSSGEAVFAASPATASASSSSSASSSASASTPAPITVRGVGSLGSSGSGVATLSWSPDGSLLAAGTGSGALVLASVVGRKLVSPTGFEATLVEPCRVAFIEVSKGVGGGDQGSSARHPASNSSVVEAAAEFRERVCELSVGFGHAIVATATQIHVFSVAAGLSSPVSTLDTPKAPVALLVQSSRGFAYVDTAGGLAIFTYDGRPVAGVPKLPEGALRPQLCSKANVALGPDTIAILDGAEKRVVRCFELRTGRMLCNAPYTHPTTLAAIALSQGIPGPPPPGSSTPSPFGTLPERRLALLDTSGDIYITAPCGVNPGGKAGGGWPPLLKLGGLVDDFAWGETHDSLFALVDGGATVFLWPHGATEDGDLCALARVSLPASSLPPLLSLPSLVGYSGGRAEVSRGDGALVHVSVAPLAPLLHEAVGGGKWEEALRLARLARSPPLWAALASMALHAGNLDAAEMALAAVGAADKLEFLRHIKAQVLPEIRASELAVMMHKPVEEAEGYLLSAQPPLVYRAVKLNIRLGRWGRALDIAKAARAHVDTVLHYRSRYLSNLGASETLPPFLEAMQTTVVSASDWPAVKARKDGEKAREHDKPGARALPLVCALEWKV